LDPPLQGFSGAAKKFDIRWRDQQSGHGFKNADTQGHQNALFKHLCCVAIIFAPECLGHQGHSAGSQNSGESQVDEKRIARNGKCGDGIRSQTSHKIQIHPQIDGKHHHADGDRYGQSYQSFEYGPGGQIDAGIVAFCCGFCFWQFIFQICVDLERQSGSHIK